jgi:hypothetical protein
MRTLLSTATALLSITAHVLGGPILNNPSDEALAVLMSTQEGQTSYLMRRFGLLTNSLEFTSSFQPGSFQFALVPGSLFNTFPIELTTTGIQTAPGSWSISGTGFIDDPINFDIFEINLFDFSLDPADPDEEDWDGKDGEWDWHGHKTWRENPLDPGELLSSGYILYSRNGIYTTLRPIETDFRRRFIDEDGTWHTQLNGPFELGGKAILLADGAFDRNGVGGFVVRAVPVPEPASALGLLSGLGAMALILARKKTR